MEKYYINDLEVTRRKFDRELENLISDYVDDNIDDIIDEVEEVVRIGSLEYLPSEVLKKVDTVAYRCCISEQVNALLEDANYDLESYGEYKFKNNIFKIEEEE